MNYNRYIHSFGTRSNGDIKLIPTGSDTKDISAYLMSYATKSQAPVTNMSALLVEMDERTRNFYPADYVIPANTLLVKLVNYANSRQEIGAPMAVATVMGWAPRVCSHTPRPVYLADVYRVLRSRVLKGFHPGM